MILITGGNGFVGNQIVRLLNDKKEDIRLILREGAKLKFRLSPNVKILYSKDLFKEDVEWWKNALEGVDTVVHAAWYNEPGEYLNSYKNLDCLSGTIDMAKACVGANVKRFIGIGTCFEYELDNGLLYSKTPLNPKSIYAASKASAYLILKNIFKSSNVSFAWCRLFYLYGEFENENRLVPYIRAQLEGGKFVHLTSGKQVRDFIDVRDAGEQIVSIIRNDAVGPINICSGVPITVRQLAENVADEYKRRDLLKFGTREDNETDPICIIGVKN
jgi:dTDP-6-deoxy-L-talose 4-dehydrogenase (NAD+)